jgi:sugar lactone lactonase YvrE
MNHQRTTNRFPLETPRTKLPCGLGHHHANTILHRLFSSVFVLRIFFGIRLSAFGFLKGCFGYLIVFLLLSPPLRAAAPLIVPLGSYSEGLEAPARVATDAAGNVYITDPQAGRVVVFDAFGRMAYAIPGFAGPLGIAVDAGGWIYLAEENRGCVTVFDAQWNPLFVLGRGDQEFALPNYLAPDPAAGSTTVYVSDSKANQIKVYRNGVFTFSFGSQGTNAAQFDFPTGLFVSTNGEVFVVDHKNDRIQVFDRDGGFLRMFSLVTPLGGMGLGSAGGRSQGILADAQGRLLVADSFQGFVRVFDPQGNYAGKIAGFGKMPGELNMPVGLARDRFNRLFTASLNNGRVEVLGMDGFAQLSAIPARQVVPAGTNVFFSVTVTNPAACLFQWRKGATPLMGATNPVLNLASVTPADSGQYSVEITGVDANLTSPAAALTVLVPPSILGISSNQTVLSGTNATFSVTAVGDALSYRWFFRGFEIVGATSPSLTLANVQPDSAGVYSVLVQNAVGTAASPPAQLTVLVPPGPPTIEYTTLLPGAGMQLTVNGDMGYAYWIDSGTNLVDWVAVTNIVNTYGSLDVILPPATNSPHQFYRMRWTP